MKKAQILLLSLFALSTHAGAQQFVNGNLEPKFPITTCTPVDTAVYNANMGGVRIIGPVSKIIHSNSSCASGAAASGTYYTGLKFTRGPGVNENNRIGLKLTTPMTAGVTYKLSFSYKIDNGSGMVTSGGRLIPGYSNDSTNNDSIVNSFLNFDNTTWANVDTIKITPKVAAQYIWLVPSYGGMSAPPSGTIIIHVDNFKLITPTSGIEQVLSNNEAMDIAPNPMSGYTNIGIHESVGLPATITLTDMYGRVVRRAIASTRSYRLDRNDMDAGIYFMNLVDEQGYRYTKQLVVQ